VVGGADDAGLVHEEGAPPGLAVVEGDGRGLELVAGDVQLDLVLLPLEDPLVDEFFLEQFFERGVALLLLLGMLIIRLAA
jgi:hypothetical protein